MNSKQFPFRFFSAYHVLDQLVEEYNKKSKFIFVYVKKFLKYIFFISFFIF